MDQDSQSCCPSGPKRYAMMRRVECFVLLEPTPKVYRVPRVSPGVSAPKLFPPTSVAGYAGPSSSLQTTPEVPVRGSEWGPASAWPQEWGRGGKGIPISSLVVEMLSWIRSGSSELEALRVSNGTEDFPFRSVALFYYMGCAEGARG